MSVNGLLTSILDGFDVGSSSPTSPLIAHSKVGYGKCWLMGFTHKAQMGSMWAAQAHQPTNRPFDYHVLRRLFPPPTQYHYDLRPRAHSFELPCKDDKKF